MRIYRDIVRRNKIAVYITTTAVYIRKKAGFQTCKNMIFKGSAPTPRSLGNLRFQYHKRGSPGPKSKAHIAVKRI